MPGRLLVMSSSRRNIRGLRDISTISGRVGAVREPYRAYMRISYLEMERARRDKELQSALRQITQIRMRFQEIDAEKKELLISQGERGRGAPTEKHAAGRPEPEPKVNGFKVRY